jgi:ATP/maltotriose-dependent transcriptional regulator MalT
MLELIKTKLFIPRPRQILVSRPRLTERLNAGLNKKLTLLAAPAGYGKTTLLSEWIPQSPRCVTWLSLDDGDNDPTQFWAYFISSLQQLHPDIGAGALAQLQSSRAIAMTSILTSLINDITAFPDQFASVLDDYHFIDLQPIHDTLIFFINHLPANMHLVITSRVDPNLPLARLRARDKLTELRASDLRFSVDEAAEFLNRSMELNLSGEEVAALEMRTEGWIAGLQIAALSMQGREDLEEFIRAFSGSHRHILGYLADEVLEQRPKGTLNFLLKTSILDRLCGDLCDAVTGDSGGEAILSSLERANLFITPLDDIGVWYRYNQLFAEVLQLRLKQTWPDLVNELHTRAGIWYASQGKLEEAINHALAGSNYAEASCLIESAAGNMLRRGASVSLVAWLDALPEEMISSRPYLSLARGWALFMGAALDLDGANRWAQRALEVARTNGLSDTNLIGEATALQAMIAATQSEVAHSLDLSQQALANLSEASPWRNAVVFCLGTAYYLSGDMVNAAQVFEEAINLSQTGGEHYIQFAAASFLGEILVFQARLSRAMEMYKQVLDWAGPALPQKGGVMAHAGCAAILYERNQLGFALEHIELGLNQVDQVGGAWSAYVLNRVLARIQHAQGHWSDAFETLDRAYQLGKAAKVSLVVAQAAALQACLQLSKGDLDAAAGWALESGLNPDDLDASHPGWKEIEYLALARILAAQGKHPEALSLLDRLSNAAEAEGRFGDAIAIYVVQALVNQASGNHASGYDSLEKALILAEPEGYMRIFLDEGEPMRLLLTDIQHILIQRAGGVKGSGMLRLLRYVDEVLAAFPGEKPSAANQPHLFLEPLSERELEILQLIAAGHSNQEIADILIIALSTVKSHINSIYGKLGTHKRTQAVALAREKGLLSD